MKRFLFIFIVFTLISINASCAPYHSNDFDPNPYDDLITCSEDRNQAKCSDPDLWEWRINRTDFDGKGMTIKLLHGAPEELDPNLSYFRGERKDRKEYCLYEIEEAYNISLSIEKYPAEAAWGNKRISWINDLENSYGHIFAISSSWIPQLAEKESIAVLENVVYNQETSLWEQSKGHFTNFNFNAPQDLLSNNYNNKVYGYSVEEEHADHFLYYNQDLIDKYNLEDPATLWNENKWDWTTFCNFLETAQKAFDENRKSTDPEMYAFGGNEEYVLKGILASEGGKLVDLENRQVLLYSEQLFEIIERLKPIKNSKLWSNDTGELCDEFLKGNQLFQPGELWYISSKTKFNVSYTSKPIYKPTVSVVPYPTKDGDALTKSLYKIPSKQKDTYVIRDVINGENGLTTKVVFNLLDDFFNCINPEFVTYNLTKEEIYRTFLSERIKSNASVEAIMSIEKNLEKYLYIEYIDEVQNYLNEDEYSSGYYWAKGLLNEGSRTNFVLGNHQERYQNALNELIG